MSTKVCQFKYRNPFLLSNTNRNSGLVLDLLILGGHHRVNTHSTPCQVRIKSHSLPGKSTLNLPSIVSKDKVRGRKMFVFFLVCFFFGFPVLTIFHAICSILELETAISTVCATVLSSNHLFSIVFSTVFATVCSMFCPFSMLFAAFLSWNLHFHRMCNILQLHSSQYLQDFGAEG